LTTRNDAGLTPLEVASGIVFGLDPDRLPRNRQRRETPLGALEAAVRRALERPPCLVSFSGGRDSSAILAIAASVARREGLPLPVPATNRFPEVPESEESSWQERTVATLRLEDWLRFEFGDELDCVGPIASDVLRRHGLLWPCNAHFHVPLLRAARGGSLLTGIGGDEAFSTSRRRRAALLLSGSVRPIRRDVLRLGFGLAPRALRRAALRRKVPLDEWLRRPAQAAVAREWAEFAAGEPLRWREHVRWCSRLRYVRLGLNHLDLLAGDDEVRLVHPFTDERFLSAFSQSDPADADRAGSLRAVVGELLPDDVLGRQTKASFDGAFFSTHSREFAASWAGEGADAEIVDVDRLQRHWQSARPTARTFTQLQVSWLAVEGRKQEVERARETVPAATAAELPRR
jgi:asparagine synthetase B (glutamine-hydrolysing)